MFGECKLEQDTLSKKIKIIKQKKTAAMRFFLFCMEWDSEKERAKHNHAVNQRIQ
jgi:hypothetical protein